jgi:uroporphyrinogen-III synthase
MSGSGFGGRRVVSFESRRSAEMASLIARHGGAPVSAPSMREVLHPVDALADPSSSALPAARVFAEALREGAFDVVVLMTGVGTRALIKAVAPLLDTPELAAALTAARDGGSPGKPGSAPTGPVVIARGPKPAAALREIGVNDFVIAPEPNTWREVLALVREATRGKPGARVAVQEHGAPSRELYAELERDGHRVDTIALYRWALPEDLAPLRAAIQGIVAGEIPIALFTSATQVHHVMRVAAEDGADDALRRALCRGVVASIGPVCTEGLEGEGIRPDLEPEHPKMGHLVKEAAARSDTILAAKAG